MSNKTKVIIFGLKDEAPAQSGCSCSSCGDTGCGPAPTMGEMYEEMTSILSEKLEDVEFEFVDVMENDLDEHVDALELMKKEFPIPYTKINGKMMFYGGISSEAIFEEIKNS